VPAPTATFSAFTLLGFDCISNQSLQEAVSMKRTLFDSGTAQRISLVFQTIEAKGTRLTKHIIIKLIQNTSKS